MKAIDLILKIDELSLEEFCSEAIAIQLKEEIVSCQQKIQEEGKNVLAGIARNRKMTGNKPIDRLHLKMSKLHEKQMLPLLRGLVGSSSLVGTGNCYDDSNFRMTASFDDGEYHLTSFRNGEWIEESFDIEMDKLSSIYPSDHGVCYIAATNKVPDYYYLLSVGVEPEVFACSNEQFIKIMVGFSLLVNVNNFEDFLDWKSKKVKFDENVELTSLAALNNAVFGMELMTSYVRGTTKSIFERYWECADCS